MRFTSESADDALYLNADLAISALGYESRATKIARTFFEGANHKACIGFSRNLELHYEQNLTFFRRAGFDIHEKVDEIAFQETFSSILAPFLRAMEKLNRVAIDVSSFDRFRLAIIVQTIFDLIQSGTIGEAVFFYNIAKYTHPSSDFSFNTRLQPVHPSFVGTRLDPSAPTAAVIGLGYEREKAVGAAEYLEASEVFAFHPRSQISEYFKSVETANSLLLSQLDSQHKIVYEVSDPAGLISDLSSLVRGLMSRSAVLMIPLGPKMFALACLFTARLYPRSSVWRMSQVGGVVVDRVASDNYSILRVSA